MAGLAADPEAVPLAIEAVGGGVEKALVAGGVTFHAHEVGVLVRLAPVQRVLEVHALARVEVEPAVFLGIPGDAKGLQTAVADVDQVLLQRRDAKGIGHFEVGVAAIFARGVDPEVIAPAQEARGLAFSLEGLVVEVRQHALGTGLLHRQLVVRALPILHRLAVTALALLFIDHLRRWQGWCEGRAGFGRQAGLHRRRGRQGARQRCAAGEEPAQCGKSQYQQRGAQGKGKTGEKSRNGIRCRGDGWAVLSAH